MSGDEKPDSAPIPIARGASGRPMPKLLDEPEEFVCFCHDVRVGELARLIEELKSPRVQDYVRRCQAGGGCGSCRPDIADLIEYLLGVPAGTSFDG